MSDQGRTQAITKRRSSRSASKQSDMQVGALQRAAKDDKDTWKAPWEKQGQPWRTEPEIDEERQKYLDERRSIVPVIEKGIYPFKDIKLNRADVEWLLATHENGGGPVVWNDESQREREGPDLRGANLRNVDLSGLPLARMIAGLFIEGEEFTEDQLEASASHMEKVNFKSTHLEGANLNNTHLEGANFANAYLEETDFAAAHLEEAHLMSVHLERARFTWAHLERAGLSLAHLEGADLRSAHLEGAIIQGTHLEGASFDDAHLEGADLQGAHLEGANLCRAFFESTTRLDDIVLCNKRYGSASLVDVHWNDVNIAVVDWSIISVLGDEHEAAQADHDWSFDKENLYYSIAMRAYRQLAIVLRDQGLNEDANRFAYRAQFIQRVVFRRKRKRGQYLGSLFLDLLAGYGYKPIRSFIAYLIVITAFATVYFIISRTAGPVLSPLGSFVFSMTSFHGRGFFPGGIKLDDPLTVLAALEAFLGLLIEVTFIATLTRRLFGG